MVQSVNIPLTPQAADALRTLARQELRDPRLQARWLVEHGLQQAGVLAAPEMKTVEAPPTTAAE